MAKKPKPEDIRDVLAENRAQALSYVNDTGITNVRQLLALAEQDLTGRLGNVKGVGTFTEEHMRAMLMQVRLVTKELVEQLTFSFADHADTLGEMAATGQVDYLMQADESFRGVGTTPLAIREASVLDVAKMGARSSMLRTIAESGTGTRNAPAQEHKGRGGVLQRYGLETIGVFEEKLRVGVVTRKGIDQVREDIHGASTFLQDKPAFWAERIARTELMGAYNRAGWEANREVDEQTEEEMVKILCATFDHRTAADSYAVHGQIRRPEEPFDTWYGQMMHPPARPNDREIVVPHRIAWEIPPYLKPRSHGETAARWMSEGRKTAMPEIPPITTVDLDLFGKEPKKKEPEEVEPTEGMQDVIDKGRGPFGEGAMQEQYGPDPNAFPPPEELQLEEPMPEVESYEAAQEKKQAKTQGIMGKMKKGPFGQLQHGLPFTKVLPWEGFSDAEQQLISDLSDEKVEADAPTEKVNPSDVIAKGKSATKVAVQWGIEDHLTPGMAQTPTLIKKDGLHYAYTGEGTAIGGHLLGLDSIDAHVIDLDHPDVKAKFDAVKEKPAPVLSASEILATKTGEKKGSNEGGFYRGSDGKDRYVKAYGDPAQAHCENIANKLYKDLKLSAPTSQTFEHDGKTHYAHEITEGQTLSKHGLSPTVAKQILNGFAADMLLGNRDVIGLSKDNILIKPDGSVHRLDNGGSLLMRANAGKKKLEDQHSLKEWDGFFNHGINTYAEVLDAAGVKKHADMKKQLVKGIKDINALQKRVGGWNKYVEHIAPSMADEDRRSVVTMLDTRSKLLNDKLKLLQKKVVKPKPIVLEPGAWGPKDTTTYDDLHVNARHEAPQQGKETPNGKSVGWKSDPGTYKGDGHQALMDHTTVQQRSAIVTFTGSEYGDIRKASMRTKEEFAADNYGSSYGYEEHRKNAEHIEAAFNAIPEDKRVEGIVFRGIMVPRVVANEMLKNNATPHLPGQGAMFSPSRTIDVAHRFMHRGTGDTHVLMVINQKRGVPIETISGISGENEVLMSGQTKCRLTDHYVVKSTGGANNVLVLHLEEVTQ